MGCEAALQYDLWIRSQMDSSRALDALPRVLWSLVWEYSTRPRVHITDSATTALPEDLDRCCIAMDYVGGRVYASFSKACVAVFRLADGQGLGRIELDSAPVALFYQPRSRCLRVVLRRSLLAYVDHLKVGECAFPAARWGDVAEFLTGCVTTMAAPSFGTATTRR